MEPSLDQAIQHLYRAGIPVLEVRGPNGEAQAYVVRPEVLPAELRPNHGRPERRFRKAPLSKRQRDAAKREKLRPSL